MDADGLLDIIISCSNCADSAPASLYAYAHNGGSATAPSFAFVTQGGQRYTPLAEAFLLASPVLVPLDQQTNATVNTAAFADLDGDGWDEAYLAGRAFFPGVPSAACCAPTYIPYAPRFFFSIHLHPAPIPQ